MKMLKKNKQTFEANVFYMKYFGVTKVLEEIRLS